MMQAAGIGTMPLSMLSAGRQRARTLDLLSWALVYPLDVLRRKGEQVWSVASAHDQCGAGRDLVG